MSIVRFEFCLCELKRPAVLPRIVGHPKNERRTERVLLWRQRTEWVHVKLIPRSLRENHWSLPYYADLSRSQTWEVEAVSYTQFSLHECSSSTKPCRVRATVEDKTITIARLSRSIVEWMLSVLECPQIHMSLDLNPQHVSIALETDGNTQIDVMGYVHDVDVNSLMALKRQLGDTSEAPSEPATQEKELSFEPFDTTVWNCCCFIT